MTLPQRPRAHHPVRLLLSGTCVDGEREGVMNDGPY